MDKELLSKKLNLQVCKKEMITNCLKSFNLPTKYKYKKDAVDALLNHANNKNIDTIIKTCHLTYLSIDVQNVLHISKYQLQKLRDYNKIVPVDVYKTPYGSYAYLYDIIAINKMAKENIEEILKSCKRPRKKPCKKRKKKEDTPVKVNTTAYQLTPDNLCEAIYVISQRAMALRDRMHDFNYMECYEKYYNEYYYADQDEQFGLYDKKRAAINKMHAQGLLQITGYYIQFDNVYLINYSRGKYNFCLPQNEEPPYGCKCLGKINGFIPILTRKSEMEIADAECLIDNFLQEQAEVDA